jgi:hypothetical protein
MQAEVHDEIVIAGPSELDSTLEFVNGLIAFSLIQVNPAQRLMGRRKFRIQFQRLLHLVQRLVVTAGYERDDQ